MMPNECPHLHTAANQDGAAILDVERGVISTLNRTGAYVWQRIERGETIETIASHLARETGQELETVERDVRDFFEALNRKHNLGS
ncbi:PqqD family protein [Edaphobacter sp. HDX4]|uniref:PqqD family protein n=1 Tax=Edaphobacter sp. HDX4 TaxID=2794064 RepID=UPI002FE65EF2